MFTKRTVLLGGALVLLLALASTALASSSTSYGLRWNAFSGGGSTSTGSQYRVQGSIVTSGMGVLESSSYRVSLGYWPGIRAIPAEGSTATPTSPAPTGDLYLPLVRRGN